MSKLNKTKVVLKAARHTFSISRSGEGLQIQLIIIFGGFEV